MEGDFRYDPKADKYFETSEYEARALHMQFIEAYEEVSFWSQLAARDLAAEVRLEGRDRPVRKHDSCGSLRSPLGMRMSSRSTDSITYRLLPSRRRKMH